MLDFTALDSIPEKKKKKDFSELLDHEEGNYTPKPEKPATGEINAFIALDQEQRDRAKLREAYSTYQENIKRAGMIRAEILKGIKQGEEPLDLLLKAVECISLMTGDSHIYSQSKADIVAIYGYGLGYKAPLHHAIEEAKARLEKLERAEASPEEAQRIQNAIRAHRELIETAQSIINRGTI